MKFFSILSLCLFFSSCGQSHLENADIETKVLSEDGIMNKVKQGESWDDVKLLAGEYWDLREDKASNFYQIRKDIDMSTEQILVSFELSNNKVAGISLYIKSKNISKVAMLIFQNDVIGIYKDKFGVNLENENGGDNAYDGKSFHFSSISDLDAEVPLIHILCFES